MTRDEHLIWCKGRALGYCDDGDTGNAWASMASDMGKHDETRNHPALEMGTMLMLSGNMNTVEETRKFIEGFN